jgi:hypothetical protein
VSWELEKKPVYGIYESPNEAEDKARVVLKRIQAGWSPSKIAQQELRGKSTSITSPTESPLV